MSQRANYGWWQQAVNVPEWNYDVATGEPEAVPESG